MYLPYLRGRQFELIALRELVENDLIGNNIIPIIEPIKLTSTLLKTMDAFINSSKSFSIIHNPQVGSFMNDIKNSDDNPLKETYIELLKDNSIFKAHIVNKNSAEEIRELFSQNIKNENLILINRNRDHLDIYKDIFTDGIPKYNLMPDESTFRRKITNNKVILNDKFNKQDRNVDYLDIPDEFFSDDNLYYSDEGYVGFSDYSIVGSEYSESGFAPYAVAIHIVYFDQYKNLRIKHFTSESNEDINDPAKKFYQAVSKLVEWQKEVNIETCGMEKFVEHHNKGTYPGLGTVKKYSIMHHIELVSKHIAEV